MMTLHPLPDTQVRERKMISYLSFASLKLVLAQKLQNLLHQDETLLTTLHQRTQANTPRNIDLILRNLPNLKLEPVKN